MAIIVWGGEQLVTSAENGTFIVSSEAVVSNCLRLGGQLHNPPHSLWVNLERGFVCTLKKWAPHQNEWVFPTRNGDSVPKPLGFIALRNYRVSRVRNDLILEKMGQDNTLPHPYSSPTQRSDPLNEQLLA